MLLLTVEKCVCCSWVFIAGRTVIAVVFEPHSPRFPSHPPTHHSSVKRGGNVSNNKERKPRSPREKNSDNLLVLVSVLLCRCWVNNCTVHGVTLSNSFGKNFVFLLFKKCFQFLNPWDIYLIHPPVFMCTENRRWMWCFQLHRWGHMFITHLSKWKTNAHDITLLNMDYYYVRLVQAEGPDWNCRVWSEQEKNDNLQLCLLFMVRGKESKMSVYMKFSPSYIRKATISALIWLFSVAVVNPSPENFPLVLGTRTQIVQKVQLNWSYNPLANIYKISDRSWLRML